MKLCNYYCTLRQLDKYKITVLTINYSFILPNESFATSKQIGLCLTLSILSNLSSNKLFQWPISIEKLRILRHESRLIKQMVLVKSINKMLFMYESCVCLTLTFYITNSYMNSTVSILFTKTKSRFLPYVRPH